MARKMIDRIMEVVALDIGEKKILSNFNRISLANIAFVLGKPIKNRVLLHHDVYKGLCNDDFDNKYTTKVEEELYYLAETDPNQLGSKYEALKGNAKILHSKGNALRLFITRDSTVMKILAICKAEIWHKDERKVISLTAHRNDNWKTID